MEVVAGGAHFCALINGDVYTWGGNEYGQLGDEAAQVAQPRPMLVLREVIVVACGWNHSLAITRYHECVAWGSNCSGQLGNGTQIDRSTPVEVIEANVLGIEGGFGHSLAVVDQPGLMSTECFAWGANVSEGSTSACMITRVGQLALVPTKVRGLTDACKLSCGRNHSLVIKKGGDLFSWGRNNYGQLGIGSSMNQLVPQRVMENVRAVAAGMDFSVAVSRHGECFAWGRNRNGEVGDGSTLDHFTPVKVLDGVQTVVAGHSHTLAILGNGDCVSWGRNTYECVCSAYEQGRPGDVCTPMRVLHDVSVALAAESQSIALLRSGAYQVWGRNWSGIAQSLGALGGMAYLRQAPAAGPNLGDLSGIEVQDDQTIWVPPKEEITIDVDPVLYAAFFGKKKRETAAPAEQNEDIEANCTNTEDEEKELTPEEARKAFMAADEAWSHGPSQKHGKDVHKKVHGRALAQGRPYAVRWAEFRRRKVQELMESGAGLGIAISEGDAADPSADGVVRTVQVPRELQLTAQVQGDHAVLQQFHADMWKRVDRYKRHKEESKGDDAFMNAWPKEDHDIHFGLLALEKSLRKATKAMLKTEELFGTPPLTPRSTKAKVEMQTRRRSRELQRAERAAERAAQ